MTGIHEDQLVPPPDRWVRALPGEGYWAITRRLGYDASRPGFAEAFHIFQNANGGADVWPGMFLIVPPDMPPLNTVEEPPEPPVEEPSALLGAYMGDFSQQCDIRYEELTGVPADLMSIYYQAQGLGGSTLNRVAMNARIANGTIPIIAVSTIRGPWTHAQIAAGQADAWLDYWANAIAALDDGETWFAFDIEFEVKRNHNLFSWTPSDADYAQAFNRFASKVKAARAATVKQQVKIVHWWGYSQHTAIDNIGRLIAAGGRADIFAFDPYVWSHWPSSTTFEQMLSGNGKLDWTRSRSWYDGQPIGLGEFGKDAVHGQESCAEFLTDLRPRMDAAGVAFGVYFSRDKSDDIGSVALDLTPAGTWSGWPGTSGSHTKGAGSLAGGAAAAAFAASARD